MTDVNAHPNGELENFIDQQRTDTVDWQRNNNLSPQGESPVVAEVHVSDLNEEITNLGQVTLSSSSRTITGSVLASTDDEFWVDWEDGNQSIEKKANYKLVSGQEAMAPNTCPCGQPGCDGNHSGGGAAGGGPAWQQPNPSTGQNQWGTVGPAGGIKY